MQPPEENRRAFWTAAKVLLNYKRQLALVLLGAVIAGGAFGAGLGMILPIMKILLEQQQTLDVVVYEYLGGGPEGTGRLRDQVGDFLAARVPPDPLHAFIAVMGVVAVLTVVGNLGRYMHGFISLTVAHRATMVWRNRLFDRLVHAPLTESMYDGSSKQVSRLIHDTGHLTVGFKAIIGRSVVELTKMLAALTLAFLINWQLTLVALAGAPLIGLLANYFGRRIRRAVTGVLEHAGRMVGIATAALSNPRVVKTHGAEAYERRRFRCVTREIFREQMKMRQAQALASPVNEVISLCGVLAVAIIAAWFVLRQGTPPEEFFAVMAMLIGAGSSVKPLTRVHTELKEAEAGAQRVIAACSLPVEPVKPAERSKLPLLPRHSRNVSFDRVCYTYPGNERPALDDVSLDVTHGQRIAIVGGNGSGKTTLLSMVPRLLDPDEGHVYIDGVDIRTVNLRSLRNQMAVVTQEPALFAGTIADNIAYGQRWISRDRIEAAAQAAYAHEFITSLSHGYDTHLAEHGVGLSGGQRQRLCLARAILREPAILILDEATSQIDVDSEEKINRALREFSEGRTTFVIAHRFSTVIDADIIVLMDDGRIVDLGPHDELIRRCEHYRILAQTQLVPAET